MGAKFVIFGESQVFISRVGYKRVPKHEIAAGAFFRGREEKIQRQAAPRAQAPDLILTCPVDMGPQARAGAVNAEDMGQHLTAAKSWNHESVGPRGVEVLLQPADGKNSLRKHVAEMRNSIQILAGIVAAERTKRGPDCDHIRVIRDAAVRLRFKNSSYR